MSEVRAYILIKAEPSLSRGHIAKIAQQPEVDFASMVTGPYDVIVAVTSESTEALGDVVTRIRQLPGVVDTMTLVVVSWHRGPLWGVIGPP